jgi:hypothetical protein
MPDMKAQIAAAQAAYDKSREVYEPLVDAEQATHTAFNNALGSGNQQQIAAAKAAWDHAQAQVAISVTSMNNALFQLQGLRDSYNTALSQSSNPAQQQAIASNLYTQSADTFRTDTYASALGAIGTSDNAEYVDFMKDTAINAEENFQSSLNFADDDFDSFTADIAGGIGLGDLGDLTGSDLLNFDDGSAGDSGVAGADGQEIVVTGVKTDKRMRIKPFRGGIEQFLSGSSSTTDKGSGGSGGTLLDPLRDTGGIIFPYTPVVSFEQAVSYNNVQPTHANTDYYIYQNTPSVRFTIQAQFSAQTQEEAKYLLAAMHFFRAATKMRFGATDDNRGHAPPVLKLTGYGAAMIQDLPIILLSFNMDLPNNVNYVSVHTELGEQWVPALTTFNVSCVVQQTPAQHRDVFNWDEFASGKLLGSGGGWF